MALNLNETWNGEQLLDVRTFIQSQLKKGFVGVNSYTDNVRQKVVLTFINGDGSTTSTEFSISTDESTGVRYGLNIRAEQSIYSTDSDVNITYAFSFTDGGNTVPGSPSITFNAYPADNTLLPDTSKSLWSTVATGYFNGTVTIPNSSFEGNVGNIAVIATASFTYKGETYTTEESNTYFNLANCRIKLDSSFNLINHIKGYSNTDSLRAGVTYIGSKNATINVYVDGTLQCTSKDDEIYKNGVPTASTYTFEIPMSEIGTNGLHTIQVVASMDTGLTDASGNPIYIDSNSVLFDFYKGLPGKHVGIRAEFESSTIIEDPINLLVISTEQYGSTTIIYGATTYIDGGATNQWAETTSVSLYKGTTKINTLDVSVLTTSSYTFRDTSINDYVLKFNTDSSSRIINIDVKPNSSGVAVESGALIDITAAGRSNLEEENVRNKWVISDGTTNYTGVLTNFNFEYTSSINGVEAVDGWTGDSLKFLGNTTFELDYKPFAKFDRNNGYYIEFNIQVDSVLDSDAYILSAMSSTNRGGFYLKAEEAGMISNSGTVVSTPIAAGTRYNIGFMIKNYQGDATGTSTITTLLELYVNGVRSGVIIFGSSDSFNANATIKATGLGAIWQLYGMRVYNKSLTPLSIYRNYLTTLSDIDKIVELSGKNDILDTTKETPTVDHNKLISKGKNVLIIEVGTGEWAGLDSNRVSKVVSSKEEANSIGLLIPHACNTKDEFLDPTAAKKKNFLVKGLTYYNNGSLKDPYSFKTGPTLMQVQGTSSTYYARKNYDIFFRNQQFDKDTDKSDKDEDNDGKKDPIPWTSSFDTSVGGIGIENPNTITVNYKMSAYDLGVPCLCLKADYSDSSSLHNTCLTRLVNDVWFNLGSNYRTPPQQQGTSVFPEIRVGINGHPIDVFVKSGNEYTYIGKYNMNNEKKDSHHVYGFEGQSGRLGNCICVEFLENNTQATLFDTGSTFDWTTCTPDGGDNPQLEFRYPPLDDWNKLDDNEYGTQKKTVKRVFVWVKECYDEWQNDPNSKKFIEELIQYFNPRNLLSWYLYTEYFLAVDQRSKNMMLASWGATETSGVWYFLPYDGDTALGVTNDGWLILPWDTDEETIRPDTIDQYAYMGHDSTLWKLVRHFLYDDTYIYDSNTNTYKYGLEGCTLCSVAKVLRTEDSSLAFNMSSIKKYLIDDARNYWADMVYNFDADTKYIAPLTHQTKQGTQSSFAQFVQGARDAHRDWLINKRFRMLDSKYGAGFFINDEKALKLDKEGLDTNTGYPGDPASIKVTSLYTAYIELIKNTSNVIVKAKLNKDVETELDLTPYGFGNNDPFKIRGISALKSINFNTLSKHISSDLDNFFASKNFNNLETVEIECENNDGILSQNVGNAFTSLTNLRRLVMKGLPNATGDLDLSNNVMLEYVDVDYNENLVVEEGHIPIIMPRSTFNITYFNVGNLNEWVPWEFWNSLNDYYYRTQNSCILVGEMIDRDLTYNVILSTSSGTVKYIIQDKYFVQIIPNTGLCPAYGNSGDIAILGSVSNTRNAQNLKRIIYAVFRRDRVLHIDDEMQPMRFAFRGCTNLVSINTRGFEWHVDTNIDSTNMCNWVRWIGGMCDGANNLTYLDLSFIDSKNIGNSQLTLDVINSAFNVSNSNLTKITYGANWFNSAVYNDIKVPVSPSKYLSKEHWDEMADYIPVIDENRSIDAKTLYIGDDNYSNYNVLTKSTRDKFVAKGWKLSASL